MTTNVTLKKAMRVLDGEPWTIGTDNGNGWLFYFDGKEIYEGAKGCALDEFMERECVDIYNRPERKYWSESDRKYFNYMELEAGYAFIIRGLENGQI